MKNSLITFALTLSVTTWISASSSLNAQTVKFDLVNLRNQNAVLTKAYDIIKVQQAWESVTTTALISPVTVGIVDTGIDISHSEFNSPKVNLGRFVLVDFKSGGHGTQVTGIIGANNVSRVTPLPANSPQMNGVLSGILEENKYTLEVRPGINTLLSLAANLESVINSGSQVVNLSFGASPCNVLSSFDKERIENKCFTTNKEFNDALNAYSNFFSQLDGVLFVSSAGNDSLDASLNLPGGLDLPNTITVGATNLSDNRADFGFLLGASNFGSVVNIVAPGVGVYAPKPGGGYDSNFGGTSASAPLVTGVAAILKALEPEYQKYTPGLVVTPEKIKEVLMKSADPIKTDKPLGSGCFDPNNNPQGYNGCRLNAHRAVAWLLPPTPVHLNPIQAVPVP